MSTYNDQIAELERISNKMQTPSVHNNNEDNNMSYNISPLSPSNSLNFKIPTPLNVHTFASPELMKNVPIKSNANNVVIAFRELQSRAKDIELERAMSLKQVNTLRNELIENKRNLALFRSKTEIDATDKLIEEKASREKLAGTHAELRTRVAHAFEHSLSLKREESDITMKIAALEEENKTLKTSITDTIRSTDETLAGISSCQIRLKEIETRLRTNIASTDTQKAKLSKETQTINDRCRAIEKNINRTTLRCNALEKYMGIILQVNNDLCNTVSDTEHARERIAKISAKYMPPRYAWPLRNNDEFNISLTQSALRNTMNLSQTVGRSSSKLRSRSRSRSKSPDKKKGNSTLLRSRSRSESPTRMRSRSAGGGRTPSPSKSKYSHNLSYDLDPNLMNLQATIRNNSPYNKNNTHHLYSPSSGNELPNYQGTHKSFVPMSPTEFARQMNSASAELDREALQTAIRSMAVMPPPWTATDDEMKVLCSAKKLRKAQQNTLRLQKKLRDSSVSVSDRLARHTTFAERVRCGDLATSRLKKKKSLQAVSGLAGTSAKDDTHDGKPVFMPVGKNTGRSNNVVASVSRATRAASYLNATIASKVKSMSGDTDGRLFGNNHPNYVTIRDLYGRLSLEPDQF